MIYPFSLLQDIDDPLWGYFVRDDENARLQGFITFTTFTNWQRSFRWDSISDTAFCYDSPELAQQTLEGKRACDDGSLAVELQQSVRCGDVYNEGIVWPRIAEISLLGGLGCGKALLSRAIDKLETMKPNSLYNYDYVVLQATENSIPFYESMGFIRVGALEMDENFVKKEAAKKSAISSDTETDESVDAVEPRRPEIVSNPNEIYEVKRAGETPAEIARKFEVDVWDIIFLNHGLYKNLKSGSYLKRGTNLYIPSKDACKADATSLVQTRKELKESSNIAYQWYIAKENDTPKGIALKFGVSCRELVSANKERLPELLPISRLKEGTRVRISHLDQHDDVYVPYTHWTAPDDDKQVTLDPSYMMVKKLNRRPSAKNSMPVHPVYTYVSPPASLFHDVKAPVILPNSKGKKKKSVMELIGGPGKPKRPLSAYVLYCNDNRKSLLRTMKGQPASELSKVLAGKWKKLGVKEKTLYQERHKEAKKQYEKDIETYEKNLELFFKKHPEMKPQLIDEPEVEGTLFNQVVALKKNAPGASKNEFKYFYVLTYIPDLVWCHLAPMKQAGYWGDDKPECRGRPKWMLVDESEGKELDISADFCTLVPSRCMYRTEDADDERWDIFSENQRFGEQVEGRDARFWENSTDVSTETEASVASITKSGKKRSRRKSKKPLSLKNTTAAKRQKPVPSDDSTSVRGSQPNLNADSNYSKGRNPIENVEMIQRNEAALSTIKNAEIMEKRGSSNLSVIRSRGRPAEHTLQSTNDAFRKGSKATSKNVGKKSVDNLPLSKIQKSAVKRYQPILGGEINCAWEENMMSGANDQPGLFNKSFPSDIVKTENLHPTKNNRRRGRPAKNIAHSKSVDIAERKVAKRGRHAKHALQSKIVLKNSGTSVLAQEIAIRKKTRSNYISPPSAVKTVVNQQDLLIRSKPQEQKVRVMPRRKANSSLRKGFYSECSPKKKNIKLDVLKPAHGRKGALEGGAGCSSSDSQIPSIALERNNEASVAISTERSDSKKIEVDVRILPRRKANASRRGFYSESSPSRSSVPLNLSQSESTKDKHSKKNKTELVIKGQYSDLITTSPKKDITKYANNTPARRLSPRKSPRKFSQNGKSTLIERSLNVASQHAIGRGLVVS